MIEWYRLGIGLQDIIDDTLGVVGAALGADDHRERPDQYHYREIFLETVGVDPLTATIDELATAARADTDLKKSVGNERDDWLDLLLATQVAPAFEKNRLTVLRHFPASQAALARLCPDDRRVADRFEVFFGSIELANGYIELTDAEEQLRRMQADNTNRRRRNRRVRPHDISLLGALEAGLPACAGVAMGFERLQMIHDDTDDIRDVITFFFEGDE